MLRLVAIQRISDGLGFRVGLDATIALRLQEAQRDLEKGKTLPLFLLQENQTLSLPATQHVVSLPTGFMREEPDNLLHYFPSGSGMPIYLARKLYIDATLAQLKDVTPPAAPQVYVLLKNTIDFIVNANAPYTLYWSYYKRGALLTSDVENEWLEETAGAPEWLIGEAGFRLAKDTRNQTAMQLFDDMRTQGRAACLAEIIAREESGGPYVMGLNQ